MKKSPDRRTQVGRCSRLKPGETRKNSNNGCIRAYDEYASGGKKKCTDEAFYSFEYLTRITRARQFNYPAIILRYCTRELKVAVSKERNATLRYDSGR